MYYNIDILLQKTEPLLYWQTERAQQQPDTKHLHCNKRYTNKQSNTVYETSSNLATRLLYDFRSLSLYPAPLPAPAPAAAAAPCQGR